MISNDEIKNIFIKPHVGAIATISTTGEPSVRYVLMRMDCDMNILFATKNDSIKIQQMNANPKVNLTISSTFEDTIEVNLKIAGSVEYINDDTRKKEFWLPFYTTFFSGPDDANYIIVKVITENLEIMDQSEINKNLFL
ncbi:MAG: pyridoxamine 5'-phosphate oxidase family protein [bacterium]